MKAIKILRPDTKGRICLGKLASGVSSYKAVVNEVTKEITLKPYTEIPLPEKWLYENEEAIASVQRGLHDLVKNKLVYRGSFAPRKEEDEGKL